MSQIPFKPAVIYGSAFNCPFCNAFANQIWGEATTLTSDGVRTVKDIVFSHCTHCKRDSVWHGPNLVFPATTQAPLPNPDLPEDIKADFEEARKVINASPRGAAALLRLCIQKLCAFLGEPGKDINTDIASLVRKGLNPHIQKSLDVVRVIGNEAVHPGTIDLKDNPDIAIHLCKLVNFIAEAMITQPKQIDELYASLPPGKLQGIEQRDAK